MMSGAKLELDPLKKLAVPVEPGGDLAVVA
jgi:hypothetical protein